jgi:hypothetical protein
MYVNNGIVIEGGGSVTIIGEGRTFCPLGHEAKYLSATYTATQDNLIQILNPSATTKEILAQVFRIAEAARTGAKNQTEALKEIAALVPAVKPIVDGWDKANIMALIALLLLILQTYLGYTKPDPAPIIIEKTINNYTNYNFIDEVGKSERPSKRQLQRARGKEKARSKPGRRK